MHKPKAYMYGSTVTTSGNQVVAATATSFEDSVNVHGLRGTLELCTETSSTIIGVNWALVCVPESMTPASDIVISDTNLNSKSLQAFIWLVGKALVHRESITRIELMPHTSRSCEHGSHLALLVRYENAIAGTTPNLRITCGINWWETQV